ncbi:MAG: sigma 54-interacting transcriptional regulator [bacterium]|nr:sigma 54-interacting transcriptional regulator [bacterium]
MKKRKRPFDFLSGQDILDSVADGVFTVDEEYRITSYNRAAEQITGFTREEAIGSLCHEIFKANICQNSCALRRTFLTGDNLIDIPVEILRKDSKPVPISVSTAILKDGNGVQVGGVESFRDLSEIQHLKQQLKQATMPLEQVGLDSSLAHIGKLLPDIAASDVTVLITGPSGTGKGLLAETIHKLSPRKEGPFVTLSCAALPESLLEAELFGHEKGAFTDAKTGRPGRILGAEGGTLFLDEIGDIPLSIQVKLLRFIQDREYEPLGSSQPKKADVRILTATNVDLRQKVEEGTFREDLFYRINVVSIELPSLNERKEDIPALVYRFIRKFNARYDKEVKGFSDETLKTLLAYDYQGNIRELENAIEHAFVLCKSPLIEPRHLPARFIEGAGHGGALAASYENNEVLKIKEALRASGGNKNLAAQSLGMHRATLWRKMRRYKINK